MTMKDEHACAAAAASYIITLMICHLSFAISRAAPSIGKELKPKA
jgi:hypothetical protein